MTITEVPVPGRVEEVERRFPGVIGRRRVPAFWPDAEVRRLLINQHSFLTLDDARTEAAIRFGLARAPSRSAIHRFWQSLDAFWGGR